ncbi:unnamed protein product [Trichobilharzia regenti]|nr:unnamed protein product [Trichobilharzia regenti]
MVKVGIHRRLDRFPVAEWSINSPCDQEVMASNCDQERGNEGLNPNNNNNNEWSYDVNSVPCLSFNKDVIVYDKRQNIPQHSSRSSLYKINEADNTSDAHLSRHNDLENKPGNYCQIIF